MVSQEKSLLSTNSERLKGLRASELNSAEGRRFFFSLFRSACPLFFLTAQLQFILMEHFLLRQHWLFAVKGLSLRGRRSAGGAADQWRHINIQYWLPESSPSVFRQ